jgi:ubiquinone/menaquinone biosynthesis C-methylase UbiE
MKAALRYVKYAFAAPIINVAVLVFPRLSRGEAPLDAINFAGGGNFFSIGDDIVESLVSLANLRDNDSVLEIGCGIGRNATALYRRFSDRLSYLGFDIVRYGITWCQKHFGTRSKQHRFVHSNIYNSFYNPRGRLNPIEYVFPTAASSTDLVFATSVFTHMQSPEVRHYIQESARVLKPGGRIYFTSFILDEDSEQQIKVGKSSLTFVHQGHDCRIQDADESDLAVAYSLPWIEKTLSEAGFQLQHIERCSWRGTDSPFYQDIVIARKRVHLDCQ